MINIKHHIDENILYKHSKYIIDDSGIKDNLNLLKEELHNKLSDKYLDELSVKFNNALKSDLLKIMCDLINSFLAEVSDLSDKSINVATKNKNIFIAKPKELDIKIAKLKELHPTAIKIIEDDKFSKAHKITYSSLILKAFNYDKFSLKDEDILGYRCFLKKLKSVNSSYYVYVKNKTCEDGKQRFYNETRLEKIKETISEELRKYDFNKELRDKHSVIESEIMDLKVRKIGELVNSITKIIKVHYDECIEIYDGIDFDINSFAKYAVLNEKSRWNAYQLVMSMGTKSCPYCNRQYITPIYSEKNGSIRADLDHFFPKSLYPYLSVSIYNLIPCCKFCNSSLKLDRNFDYESYLHPYESGFEDNLKFRFKAIDTSILGSLNEGLKIVLESDITDSEDDIISKAKKNAEVFKLESLYNYHKDEVKALIRKKMIYNKGYIKEISDNLRALLNREVTNLEVLEFIVSNNLDIDKYHERTLSKLYKDIMDQLDFWGEKDDNNFSISKSDKEKLIKLIE